MNRKSRFDDTGGSYSGGEREKQRREGRHPNNSGTHWDSREPLSSSSCADEDRWQNNRYHEGRKPPRRHQEGDDDHHRSYESRDRGSRDDKGNYPRGGRYQDEYRRGDNQYHHSRSDRRDGDGERSRKKRYDGDESTGIRDKVFYTEERMKRSKIVVLEDIPSEFDLPLVEGTVSNHTLHLKLSPPLKIAFDHEEGLAFLQFCSEGNAVALIHRSPLGLPIKGKIVKWSLGTLVVPPGLQRDNGSDETIKLIQQARNPWRCCICQNANTPIAFQCVGCGADRLINCAQISSQPNMMGSGHGPRAGMLPEHLNMGHSTMDNDSRKQFRLPIPDSSNYIAVSAIKKDKYLKNMEIPSHVTQEDSFCPNSRLYFHSNDNLYSTVDGSQYFRSCDGYLEPISNSQVHGTAKQHMNLTQPADVDANYSANTGTVDGNGVLSQIQGQIHTTKINAISSVHLPTSEEQKQKREGAKASILSSISHMVSAAQTQQAAKKKVATPSAVVGIKEEPKAKMFGLKFGTVLKDTKVGAVGGTMKIETMEIETMEILPTAEPATETTSLPPSSGILSLLSMAPTDSNGTDVKHLFRDAEDEQLLAPEQKKMNEFREERERKKKLALEQEEEQVRERRKLMTIFKVPLKVEQTQGAFGRHVGHGLCPFCLVFFRKETDLKMHMKTKKHCGEFINYWSKFSKGVVNECTRTI